VIYLPESLNISGEGPIRLKKLPEDETSIGTALSLKVNSSYTLSSRALGGGPNPNDSHCNLFNDEDDDDKSNESGPKILSIKRSQKSNAYDESVREALISYTRMPSTGSQSVDEMAKKNSTERLFSHSQSDFYGTPTKTVAASRTDINAGSNNTQASLTSPNGNTHSNFVSVKKIKAENEGEPKNPLKFTEAVEVHDKISAYNSSV